MSEFELWQLIEANQGAVTDQFQFWMATTFAVVIVSYTAGQRLALWARLIIAALYAVAATVFYLRYMMAYDMLGQLIKLLGESVLEPRSGILASVLRRIVMVGSPLLAIVLICVPKIFERSGSDNDE